MKRPRRNRRRNALLGLLFASPWIIGFLCFTIYPIASSFYYSLTNFNIFQHPKYVGFANYLQLFSDESFYKGLYNTFYMTIVGTPVYLVFALLAALLLNGKLKTISVYRTIFYLPSIVPLVASSLLWIWILNPTNGLLNNILKALHLYQPNWLGNPALTKPSLILIGMWATGQTMVIFLAALKDVPRYLHEAAVIDGAGTWSRFLHVTLPSISPVILFQVIMSVIYSFQYFTQAYVIAGSQGGLNVASGGPENSMLFYVMYLFHNAFYFLKMGKASAMAWILFVIIALVTWVVFRTSRQWVSYGNE
ncbi:MAG TPA: sugar ABC transporter permease [Spirochaetia bacterium]|nr:sugar ABC transporter permease [Spirochaetia bacterium]